MTSTSSPQPRARYWKPRSATVERRAARRGGGGVGAGASGLVMTLAMGSPGADDGLLGPAGGSGPSMTQISLP